MSRRLNLAAAAITTDGELLVNVAKLATLQDLAGLVDLASRERGAVFIGVTLSASEVELVMARLDNGADEAVARLAGRRARVRAGTRRRAR